MIALVAVLGCEHLALILAFALLWRRVHRWPAEAKVLAQRQAAAESDLLKEVIAVKAGQAIVSIVDYNQRLGEEHRLRLAAASLQTRTAEGRAAESLEALTAARLLLGDLRALVAGLEESGRSTQPTPPADIEAAPTSPVAPKPSHKLPAAQRPRLGQEDEEESTHILGPEGPGRRQAETIIPPAG